MPVRTAQPSDLTPLATLLKAAEPELLIQYGKVPWDTTDPLGPRNYIERYMSMPVAVVYADVQGSTIRGGAITIHNGGVAEVFFLWTMTTLSNTEKAALFFRIALNLVDEFPASDIAGTVPIGGVVDNFLNDPTRVRLRPAQPLTRLVGGSVPAGYVRYIVGRLT